MCDPARKAIVNIPHEYLREFLGWGLDLPPGYVAVDMREDFTRHSWLVLVTGPDVPKVRPGVEPPQLDMIYTGSALQVRAWTHGDAYQLPIKELTYEGLAYAGDQGR